jgi:hypothetical protein
MSETETKKLEIYPHTYISIYRLDTKVCIDRGNPDDKILKGFYIPNWLVGRTADFIRKPKMGAKLYLSPQRALGVEKIKTLGTKVKTEGYTFRVYAQGYATRYWVHIPRTKLEDVTDILRKFIGKE